MFLKNILNDLNFLPTNSNISFFWNLGSFLGIILMFQIFSGLILSILFNPSVDSFWKLINLTEETMIILLFRFIHNNGASLFFILVFFHLSRGLIFKSFKKKMVWLSGCSIYIILMAAAFMGYVLPWGQMSLWGGTVITNLFSVINNYLVIWMWGNFSVSGPTLSMFFTLHFILPFILLILVFFHIIFLHETGSSSKIFISKKKKKFKDFFLKKDSLNFFFYLIFLIFLIFLPLFLGDPENFIEANNLSSPIHIKPEWYFLWAYAILRAIPFKEGGVLALGMAVIILYFIILKKKKKNLNYFFLLFFIFFSLTFLGGCPVEDPFIFMSQIFSFLYFLFVMIF